VIQHAPREIHAGRRDGPRDRRAAAGKLPVEEQHYDGDTRRHARREPNGPHRYEQQRRQNRDVPSGDRDDVIRPGFLEPPFVLVRQPRAIADEDRRRDCAGLPAPPAHISRKLPAGPGARGRGRLLRGAPAIDDVHERGALHRADEHDPAARERPRLVRKTGIAERNGPSQRRRQPDRAPGAPLDDSARGCCSPDREPDAAAYRAQRGFHAGDIERDRRAERRERGILAQDPLEQDRSIPIPGRPAVEPRQEIGVIGGTRAGIPERHAGQRAADRDGRCHTRRILVREKPPAREQRQDRGCRRAERQAAVRMIGEQDASGGTGEKRDGDDAGRRAHPGRECKGGDGDTGADNRYSTRRNGATEIDWFSYEKTSVSPFLRVKRPSLPSSAPLSQRRRYCSASRPFAWQLPRGTPAERGRSALRCGAPGWR
jgi:hypothetical protein